MLHHITLRRPFKRIHLYSVFFSCWCLFPSTLRANTDSLPFTLRTEVDFGHVVNGYQTEFSKELKMQPLNRNVITIITDDKITDLLSYGAGLRSILWWPFGGDGSLPHERIVRVEAELALAKLQANLGPAEIQIGYFPHKYNPEAKNLGEYLHRSGTYPGFLLTNEYHLLLNGATPYFYGARARLEHGKGMFRHDLTLFTETRVNPIGDFSPGYEFSFNSDFLSLGGGLVLNHYLSFQPSKLAPKNLSNRYVEVDSLPMGDTVIDYRGPISSLPLRSSVQKEIAEGTNTDYTYRLGEAWSHKGIKVMGRATLNLGYFVPEGILGPEDLKLFAEVAVLGWEDRPHYYDDRARRTPVMAGFNFPAFGWLDFLTLQFENYRSLYNNSKPYINNSLPVWQENSRDSLGNLVGVTEDDWKWSVTAKKKVNKIFNIHAQVANDHLRMIKFDGIESEVPVTQDKSHWYYLIKLEFGI